MQNDANNYLLFLVLPDLLNSKAERSFQEVMLMMSTLMCLSSFQIALFSAIYILLLCCFCLTSTWAQFYQRRTEVSSDLSSSARPTLLLASHMHNFYQKGNITLNHLNRDFSFQKKSTQRLRR